MSIPNICSAYVRIYGDVVLIKLTMKITQKQNPILHRIDRVVCGLNNRADSARIPETCERDRKDVSSLMSPPSITHPVS